MYFARTPSLGPSGSGRLLMYPGNSIPNLTVRPYRYNILPGSHHRSFGSEEDNLLSIIAHNILVYMLMVGLTAKETMDMVQGFTARTRLATFEERLLQQTIRHVEQNVGRDC